MTTQPHNRTDQMTKDQAIEQCCERAREAGRDAARCAATWTDAHDGAQAQELLLMLDDGDPAVWDHLPARPNLSGQWAGDGTQDQPQDTRNDPRSQTLIHEGT